MRSLGWRSEQWVAVDFDQRTVRGVAATHRRGRWILKGWAEEESSGSPAESLRRLLERLPPGTTRLVAVLPRGLFLERVLTVPRLAPRQLAALVTQELNAVLPWTAGERHDGFAVLPAALRPESLPDHPSDGAPRRLPEAPRARRRRPDSGPLSLVAVAGQRESLEPWLKACRSAGLRITGVVPAGVALLNAFRPALNRPPRSAAGQVREPAAGLLVGIRDEVDLVALTGGGAWGFSRAFPRSVAAEEVRRSRRFAVSESEASVDLWIPEGLPWAFEPGFEVKTWRPAGSGDLPPAYWAAWGGLLTLGGRATLPLVLDGESDLPPAGTRLLSRPVALGVIAALLLLVVAAGAYRMQQAREVDRRTAAEAARVAELAAWRTVAYPLAGRLATLNALAAALPPGTRAEALRLERDRLVEFRASAPRASTVLSALAGSNRFTGLALAGPVTRRTEDGGEVFSLTGRVVAQSPAGTRLPRPGGPDALPALRTLGWAGQPAEQALTNFLLEVERAAAGAGLRLETKSTQLLSSPSDRQRLGADVSFSGGDRSLAAFLVALGERNPLLSLEALTAYRNRAESGGAAVFRLQLVLDRPAGAAAPSGARSEGGPAAEAASQAPGKTTGLAVPRREDCSALLAGRLFGLREGPDPTAVPGRSPATKAPPGPAEPPPPVRSSLILLGVVYDPAGSRALVRPAGGGATEVVKQGDAVGQEKVVEIRRDGIAVEVEGKRVRLPLP